MLVGEDFLAKRSTAAPIGKAQEPSGPSEATAIHTSILRLTLALEESRAYWEHADQSVSVPEKTKIAFENRWFGGKSLHRVQYIVRSFASRYDAFPTALSVLGKWCSMDLATRQAICHWHLQLSDPIYRKFTGEYLIGRRDLHDPKVDRAAVLRWVKSEFPEKWSDSTCVQFASKLLSAALEAGLVSRRDPRALLFPKVPDLALGYLLYLLREARIAGSLTINPYLASVGLDREDLRARTLPGVSVRTMMELVEFDWAYPNLEAWARQEVS